jgi:hypothetical protein
MEAHAFLVMFAAQILVMSVLLPGRLIKRVRALATSFPVERLAQAYPGVDHAKQLDRYLARFRALTLSVAALGLLPLLWFFNYTQRPDWDDGPVEALGTAYFLMQALPLFIAAWLSVRVKKTVLQNSSPETKRRAALQRRGLFHFVSPFVVFLALVAYFLFAAFAFYLDRHPFPGYAGALVNIGGITLVYASQAAAVFWMLYGKKINRLETDADSVRRIGRGVKLCVCLCIASVTFTSLNFALVLRDLQRWEPFAHSLFLVLVAVSCFALVAAPARTSASGELRPPWDDSGTRESDSTAHG